MRHTIRSILILAAATLPAACAGSSTAELGVDGSGGASVTTSAGGHGSAASSPAAGRPGADFVAAGNRSTYGAYTAVSSLGEAPGGNGIYRSPKYQLIGGIVATTTPFRVTV